MTYYYSLLSLLFALVFTSTFGNIEKMTISSTTYQKITDSVAEGSDHTPHTLYQTATNHTSLQQDRIPHKRDYPSNLQHTESMNITSPTEITSNEQWHAWFEQRRITLSRRLEQATQAEWSWPSTRRRCEVMRLEEEIRRLDEEEFVVPNFAGDLVGC